MNNLNNIPIWGKNSYSFSKNTFDLSLFYEKLISFYNNVGLDKDIYYAHVFNKDGLLYNPYPISGFIIKKIDFNSSFFSLFSDKDITFATDMENNQFNNNFNCMYKYNILSLYNSILKTFEGYNKDNPIFRDKKTENMFFFLFITKYCINTPEFDLFKKDFF
jgi:hypothetical protein